MNAEGEHAQPMIWIGGVQGAGKSTLAQRLATARDLPVQHIDAFTYAHLERLPPQPTLDDQLAEGPDAAADWWERISEARIRLVVEDIARRDLTDVPSLVEGPQLTPSAADDFGVAAAVWLLVGAETTNRIRRKRSAQVSGAEAHDRIARLAEREAVVVARLRADLAATGRPVVELDDAPDWGEVADQVVELLGAGLADASGLPAGDVLRRQRAYENDAVVTQISLWREAAGLETTPDFAFACECGRSGCDAVWTGQPGDFRSVRQSGPVRALEH